MKESEWFPQTRKEYILKTITKDYKIILYNYEYRHDEGGGWKEASNYPRCKNYKLIFQVLGDMLPTEKEKLFDFNFEVFYDRYNFEYEIRFYFFEGFKNYNTFKIEDILKELN